MAHCADSRILKIVGRTEDGYPIHEMPFSGYHETFKANMNAETLALHNAWLREQEYADFDFGLINTP